MGELLGGRAGPPSAAAAVARGPGDVVNMDDSVNSLQPAAPRPIRVLVVDDSAYARHIISRCLSAAPDLEVVGAACDGREALDLIPQLAPDVVTLDIDMPRLDGLATLHEIMARFPRPVVMLSSLTAAGARETVRALMAGAVDFVTKPALRSTVASVTGEVITKIRTAARARSLDGLGPAEALGAEPGAGVGRPKPVAGDKVVVVGASTGGPRALRTVVAGLRADLPAAVLIVQHMPAGFTRPLAEALHRLSALPLKEAEPGDTVAPGQILLAPGGFHLGLDAAGGVVLRQTPPIHGVRPAIDVTMAAAAQHYGRAAIGVVLTGMGADGTHGATLIRAVGGKVIAEAEATCTVWGMPRSVVEAGAADVVAELPDVARAIDQAARR
jgi:two-component system chemotaxis response regulator CheB